MKRSDLWEKYCSFYEKNFSEQVQFNEERMEKYFARWKKTDLARMLCQSDPEGPEDVPITSYSNYNMLSEFGQEIAQKAAATPKQEGELFKEYYDRIGADVGSKLNRFMTEPYYLCMKTTGTTGQNKWMVHGETFWNNFSLASIAQAVFSCSDEWGETKLEVGDKALNMNAPIPYVSGWGAWASQIHLELVPPIGVGDNLRDRRERFNLILKAIQKGEKISLGGGMGSIFYMICKYFIEPEEFYTEYYNSMNLGLKKILLYLKLLQCRLSRKSQKRIVDFMPLKGVLVAGTEARLYIDFFRKEFNLEPLHIYGSTEAGPLMRGDPDRKADLVPDIRTCYLEFMTEDGELKGLDELRKGEVYDVVVTPFGSILFKYDMQDLFRVIDFRDDGMPVFAFEGRKITMIRLYDSCIVSPNVIVQALSMAGLGSSDKWAVAKLLKPREHLHFLMEKTWPYTERQAEKVIFNSLVEADRNIPQRGETLGKYIATYRIKDPTEVVRVEYLKAGAFLRYMTVKAKAGVPIGQYKPPQIIPPEKMDIYDTLRSV